jgi:signal transduction histidine kinase
VSGGVKKMAPAVDTSWMPPEMSAATGTDDGRFASWLRGVLTDRVTVWLLVVALAGGVAAGVLEATESNREVVAATAFHAEVAAAAIEGDLEARVDHIDGMVQTFEASGSGLETLVAAGAQGGVHSTFFAFEYVAPDGRRTALCTTCLGVPDSVWSRVVESSTPGLSYDERSDAVIVEAPLGGPVEGSVVGLFSVASAVAGDETLRSLPATARVSTSPFVGDPIGEDRPSRAARLIDVSGLKLVVTVDESVASPLASRAIPIGLVVTLGGLFVAIGVHEMLERRKASAALREARAVWDVPVGVFVSTVDGRLVSANGPYLDMFGHESLEGARGFDERGLWPSPSDRCRLIEQLRRDGDVDGLETTLVRLDGTRFPARVWVRMVSETGELRGAVEDTTRERAAHRALEKSRDQFRALFESSPTPTQIQDLRPEVEALDVLLASGVGDLPEYFFAHPQEALRVTGSEIIVGSNPAMVQLLGAASAAELDGPVSGRSALAQTPEAAIEWLRRFTASREGGTCRMPMLLLGRPAVLRLNWAVPAVGGNLDYSRVVVTFTDITSIEMERERFEALFEFSPVALQLLDVSRLARWIAQLRAEGVGDIASYFSERPDEGTVGLGLVAVTAANPAAAALYGVDREALLGPVSGKRTLGASSGEVVAGIMAALAAGASEHGFSTDLVRDDGTTRHVQLRLIVPSASGHPDYRRVVVAFVDVTDIEQARRRAEELAELKSRLIASVSHELRTPLTAVVGFSDLLDRADLSSEAAEMASLIAATSRQMGGIVEDLLTAARADLGDLAIAPGPVRLITEAKAALPTVDNAGREISLTGEDAIAWADRGRVRQIVRNLVTNAVRYGAGPIRVRAYREDSHAVLRVSDRGSGVPDGAEEHLFEPYWTSGTAAGHTESVGLGLNLSRELARRMGGDLVYRRVGVETIFELVLPAAPARHATHVAG